MTLLCPIRKKEVAATPEERVRASFLTFLIEKGFPKERMVVERTLAELPHLIHKPVPERRIDILCYRENFKPLLLVECKVSFSEKHRSQILGYNHTIEAPFIVLVSKGYLDLMDSHGSPTPFKEFPNYLELYHSL